MIKDDDSDIPVKQFVRKQTDVAIDRYSETGANGFLYFGQRKVLGDRVALKFYYYNSKVSSHQEPLLLKEIKHENILEIYDAKIIDAQYAYFLTPEISGGDLGEFIDKKIISTNIAIGITQGILKGLSELHKEPNNLLHGDLKPNNILIDRDTLNPYIADFGSIKKIPETKNSVVASKNTFIYKPFEAIIDGNYYKQSDIYQVGIILFQLLNGFFPGAAADWLNVRQRKKLNKISGSFEQWEFIEECINQKIVKGKLLDYGTMPKYVSKQLKTIIRTATNVDKTKRYSNCAEFLKALFDYQKRAIDWEEQDDIIYGSTNRKRYRISKLSSIYVLEISVNDKPWRKYNKHNGKLSGILETIREMSDLL